MYLLRIIKEQEFESLEDLLTVYPNAIPVNEFSGYKDIYQVTEKEPADYDSEYGDMELCKCKHPYFRHFGCKYCGCSEFKKE